MTRLMTCLGYRNCLNRIRDPRQKKTKVFFMRPVLLINLHLQKQNSGQIPGRKRRIFFHTKPIEILNIMCGNNAEFLPLVGVFFYRKV